MSSCPFCREKVHPEALKCPYCREWLPLAFKREMVRPCPHCGEIIRTIAKLCPHCRHPVSEEVGGNRELSQSDSGAVEARVHSSRPVPSEAPPPSQGLGAPIKSPPVGEGVGGVPPGPGLPPSPVSPNSTTAPLPSLQPNSKAPLSPPPPAISAQPKTSAHTLQVPTLSTLERGAPDFPPPPEGSLGLPKSPSSAVTEKAVPSQPSAPPADSESSPSNSSLEREQTLKTSTISIHSENSEEEQADSSDSSEEGGGDGGDIQISISSVELGNLEDTPDFDRELDIGDDFDLQDTKTSAPPVPLLQPPLSGGDGPADSSVPPSTEENASSDSLADQKTYRELKPFMGPVLSGDSIASGENEDDLSEERHTLQVKVEGTELSPKERIHSEEDEEEEHTLKVSINSASSDSSGPSGAESRSGGMDGGSSSTSETLRESSDSSPSKGERAPGGGEDVERAGEEFFFSAENMEFPPEEELEGDPVFEELVQSLADEELVLLEIFGPLKKFFWRPIEEVIERINFSTIPEVIQTLELQPIRKSIRILIEETFLKLSELYERESSGSAEKPESFESLVKIELKLPLREYIERLEQFDNSREKVLSFFSSLDVNSLSPWLKPLLSEELGAQLKSYTEAKGIEFAWKTLVRALESLGENSSLQLPESYEEFISDAQNFISQFEPTYSAFLSKVIELWADKLSPLLSKT